MQDQIHTEREKVNKIDAQLVKLLSERARAVMTIGKLRSKSGNPVYDPHREREVLEHIVSLNRGPLDKGAVEDVFATIMSACRQLRVP